MGKGVPDGPPPAQQESMKQEFQTKQLMTYLVIIAIAFIFVVQWGPGSRGCDAPIGGREITAAAEVNGKEISMRDFKRLYAMQIRAQGIPESLAQQFGMPKRVLDQMIDL